MAQDWDCPAHRRGKNYVGIDARRCATMDDPVFVIGEAPGPQERKDGYPFVGPSGKLLRTLLLRAGLLDRCVFTNVVKHWPHEGRRTVTPTKDEVRRCVPALEREIYLWKPRLAILVGDTAAKAAGLKGTIGSLQGKIVESGGTAVMPIYHPAFLLRPKAPDEYRRIENDTLEALRLAKWWMEHGHEPMPDYKAHVYDPPELDGVAVDTETTGRSLHSKLLLLSASDGKHVDVWNYDGRPSALDNDLIFHNAMFDLPVLARHGYHLPETADDTQVLAWMQGEPVLALKTLARKHLNRKVMSFEQMMATPGWDAKVNYSAQDAVITKELYDVLRPRLSAKENTYYEEIARPLLPILADASVRGFLVDVPRMKEYLSMVWQRRAQLHEHIEARTWKGFNPHPSSPNTKKFLFGDLGLPPVKMTKTKTGYSTDEEVLIALSGYADSVTSYMMGWRAADKLITTYLKKLILQGHAWCYYHMTGTETGRLSTSDMNLQNLPKKIKQFLRAPDGYVFIIADYDQAELKVAACISGATSMITDINNKVDLHKKLALAVWPEYTVETLPKALRSRAKNGNFERLYGGGDDTLAEALQVPVARARVFNDLFPEWQPYTENVARVALYNGYSESLYGRRRYLHDKYSTSRALRNAAGRQAVNTPVQGTVADMINKATVLVHPWATQLGGWWQHQEHDCIILCVPKNRIDEGKAALVKAMTDVVPDILRQVDFSVTLTVSETWV